MSTTLTPLPQALLPEAAECSEVVQQLDRRSHPWPQTERARACIENFSRSKRGRALTSKRSRHHQATLSSLLMTRAGRRSVRHGRISAGSGESSSALQEVERTLLAKNDNYDKDLLKASS
ncbi:hypothetical protein AK812_SmicGene2241 [Symbiodinium microadriaticum]|uniref:Uncharacterized protein n=1 Tax=Symbiodinium microadriaticum TaxID=2951 RepID=A0A1Q9F1U7_SYMMI|nr:hypothetical protein AK812_SmicGene2241 [Symbiodinium microadriaticum]